MTKLLVKFDIKKDNEVIPNRELVVGVDMIKKSLKFEDLEEYVTNLIEDTYHGEVSNLVIDLL